MYKRQGLELAEQRLIEETARREGTLCYGCLLYTSLPQLKSFDHARFDALRAIYKNFSEADAQRIKAVSYTHLIK